MYKDSLDVYAIMCVAGPRLPTGSTVVPKVERYSSCVYQLVSRSSWQIQVISLYLMLGGYDVLCCLVPGLFVPDPSPGFPPALDIQYYPVYVCSSFCIYIAL